MSNSDGRGSFDDMLWRRGLPVNLEAERFVLSSILYDNTNYERAATHLTADDFSLDKHRRVWLCITELAQNGTRMDRMTVAEALKQKDQLDLVGGLSGLVDLDEGLQGVLSIDVSIASLRNKTKLRAIIAILSVMAERAMLGFDADELLKETHAALMKTVPDARVRGMMTPPPDIVDASEGGVNTLLNPSRRSKGVMTGFTKFDQMTGGLREGELMIMAARPSMGKSTLALDIARNVSLSRSDPRTVAIFTLEMTRESVLQRMICSDARLDTLRFRKGELTEYERRQAIDSLCRFCESPVFIDDTASLTLMHMREELKRVQERRGPLGLVIVDYLQLMAAVGRTENRNQEIGAISRGLKLMARDFDVPMIVLSQLSRKPEERPGDHRPMLSDLRESGNIEQDADMVTFVYREEMYNRDRDDLKGKAVWIIGKQRNGPIGDVNLVFVKEVTRFENPFGDVFH
jgi:replicative DNA helicase